MLNAGMSFHIRQVVILSVNGPKVNSKFAFFLKIERIWAKYLYQRIFFVFTLIILKNTLQSIVNSDRILLLSYNGLKEVQTDGKMRYLR